MPAPVLCSQPTPCLSHQMAAFVAVPRRLGTSSSRSTICNVKSGHHGERWAMTERRFQASSRRASIAQLVRTFLAGLLPIFMTQKPRNAGAEKLGDDEFAIEFGDGPIGLDLTEVRFPFGVPAAKQSSRVIVDAVKPGSQADILGKKYRLRPQVLLVSVNGKNVEGLRAKDVIKLVIDSKKEADEYEGGTLRLVFRDPLLFKEKLLNSQEGSVVETQVGVLGSEKLIVNVTKVPEECGAIRTQQGDVLEVKFTGYLAETMEVFDGSSINAQGNYFGDNSLYFVLNQGQRQAPRGWEVGLLGMCIGEERRLTIPPSLGYGKEGVPKGKYNSTNTEAEGGFKIVPKLPVPPNAVLIYDVKLVGINGINVPTDDPAALGTRVPYDYQDCKKLEGRAFECGPDVKGRRLGGLGSTLEDVNYKDRKRIPYSGSDPDASSLPSDPDPK